MKKEKQISGMRRKGGEKTRSNRKAGREEKG